MNIELSYSKTLNEFDEMENVFWTHSRSLHMFFDFLVELLSFEPTTLITVGSNTMLNKH